MKLYDWQAKVINNYSGSEIYLTIEREDELKLQIEEQKYFNKSESKVE